MTKGQEPLLQESIIVEKLVNLIAALASNSQADFSVASLKFQTLNDIHRIS